MTHTKDLPTLEQDDDLAEPLRRVAYEAGMLLGLEATRDEQAYHRRRLNRHQYWMHGFGTVAGLHVRLHPDSHANDTDPVTTRIHVSPGIAVDRLGREVMVHETYCINLREWLDAQTEAYLAEGFALADNLLWLNVTVRHRDCDVARQPVLANKLNLSTDPVQPSRTADGVHLELVPELPGTDTRYAPWGSHIPVADSDPTLTDEEQAYLDEVELNSDSAAQRLRLHSRLLRALDSNGLATNNLSDELEKSARLLLARISISISTTDLTNIIVNPERIGVNNLIRPFLATASQMAWLHDQPTP